MSGKELISTIKNVSEQYDNVLSQLDDDLSIIEIQFLEKFAELYQTNCDTPTELSKELKMKLPGISILITKLENKGYVKRIYGNNDRRVIHIKMLKKSNNVLEKHQMIYESLNAVFATKIEEEMFQTNMKLIEKTIKTYKGERK